MRIVANLLTIPGLVILYTVATALMAVALRVRLYRVVFGIGPTVLSASLRGVPLVVRPFLTGGRVQLEADAGEHAYDRADRVGREFSALSRMEMALIYAAGCACLWALACLLLSPGLASGSVAAGFAQISQGALYPLSAPRSQLRRAWALFVSAETRVWAGLVATKFVAANLLPIPPLGGFHVLRVLFMRHASPVLLTWLVNLGAILLFFLAGIYLLALTSLLHISFW